MTGPAGKFDGFFSSMDKEPAAPVVGQAPLDPSPVTVAPAPAVGKFDGFFSSLKDDRTTAARASALGAVDTNPDAYAKSVDLSRRTGLPADVVERNHAEVERKAKLDDAGKVLDTSPKLAGVLADDPSVAKLAADDLDLLGVLEKSISAYFGGASATSGSRGVGEKSTDLVRSFGSNIPGFAGGLLSGTADLNDVAGRTIERGLRASGLGPIADFLTAPVVPSYLSPSGILRAPGEELKSAADAINVPEERQNLGTDIAGGLGQITAQIALAIVNPAAGIAGLLGSGADQLSERVKDAGKEGTPEGDAAVVAGAAVTALTEKIGLDFLLKRLPPAVNAGVMKRLADVFIGGGGEALQEVAEGILQNVAEKLTVNPDAEVFEGLDRDALAAGGTGAAVRLLVQAMTKGKQISHQARKAQQAESDITVLDELVKGANSSKLRERSPDAFARVMAAQTEGTPIEKFYIPATAIQELYQEDGGLGSDDPLAQLDGFEDQYGEALAVGGDVEISAADYLTYIAGTDLHGKLKEDVRASRDGMSLRDAKEYAANPDREAELVDLVERLAIEREGEQAGQAAYDDVYSQLVAAGTYTPQQARAAATLVRERYRTRAARLGGTADADALYAQDGVRISGPEGQDRIIRDQADVVVARLKSGTTVQAAKTPVLDIVRKAGGVKVGSNLAGELKAMGVTTKTHPGLFKSKGGIGDVDNFVLSEHDIFRDNGIKDSGNGYADRDGVLEALRVEAGGRGTALLTQDERDQAARLDAPVEALRQRLEAAGLDPATMSHDEIKVFIAGPETVAADDQGALFQRAQEAGYQGEDIGEASEWLSAARKGLDMSPEARAARADEMGYTVDAYRVTSRLSEQGEPVLFFALDPEYSAEYAGSAGQGAYTIPAKIKPGRQLTIEMSSRDFSDPDAEAPHIERAMREGYDTLRFRDAGGLLDDFVVLLNPANVRSRFAAFDPARAGEVGALFQGIDPVSDLDNFWKWFGSSAVVDEDGAPVLAHYLTPMGEQELDSRTHTDGFLFSTGPAPDASLGQAIPVYLSIKSPASAEDYSAALDETQSVADAVDAMKAQGYDGIKVSDTEWIAFSAGQAKSPKNRGGFDGSDPRILFQAAYHGSPYIFDKFTTAAVGTGEGSGAYGFGLYFAGKKEIAQHYRDMLATRRDKGRLYEVDIPDDGQYLLHDTSLDEQPKAVKAALKRAGVTADAYEQDYAERMDFRHDPHGDDIYRMLSQQLGSDRAASEALQAAGVRGIKYLDRNSRFAGDGTYNYVIFADGDVVIKAYEQRETVGARGSYQQATDPYGNPANLIKLTRHANLSTFLHESGHFFLFQSIDDAFDPRATPEASAKLKADLQTALDFMGVKLDVEGSSPAELHAAITRDQHEQFARAFEAYLMEGKAPSAALRRSFDQFAAWLVRVYRKLANIPEYRNNLKPDVRAVLDRMLATDDAIADARNSAAFRVPSALRGVLTTAEQAAISKLADQASNEARRELQGRVMKELARERLEWWKAEREKQRAITERDVASRPVYQALSLLRTGKTADGSQMVDEEGNPRTLKLDRQSLVLDYGKDIIKLLPRGITGKDGISHHVFAGMVGYTDVDMLRDDLMNTEKMADVVERETDDAMKELHGDMLSDGRIAADAVEVINNDKQLELIALQGQYLRRLAGDRLGKAAGRLASEQGVQSVADDKAAVAEAGRDVASVAQSGAPAEAALGLQAEQAFTEAFAGAAKPVRQAQGAARRQVRAIQGAADLVALKAVARKVMAGKTVSDATPDRYRQQAARLGRKAEEAIAARDYEEAARLKDQQLINLFLAREAQEVTAKVEATKKKFSRLNKADSKLASSLDADFVLAAREILAPFGLARGAPDFDSASWWERLQQDDPAGAKQLRAMVDGMQQYLPEAQARVRTRQAIGQAKLGPRGSQPVASVQPAYLRMTVAQFQEVSDTVSALLTMGRNARTIVIDGERIERKAAVAEMEAQAGHRDAGKRIGQTAAITDGDRLGLTLLGWSAALERAETWSRRMDGGDANGPFSRYFIKPVFGAVYAYRSDKTERLASLLAIIEPRKGEMFGKKIKADELNYTFANKGELLHAILHTGNESNMRKLILGGRGENAAWGQKTNDGGFDRSRWDAMINRLVAEGVLTKADFDLVQNIWDLLGSTKHPAQMAHKKMMGHYFHEVEITGIDTPFGPYKGGYVPALTEADMNTDGGKRTDAEAIGQIGNAAMFPTVTKGFTKSRTEYNEPLQLNLMKLPSHLDKVLKFTHLGPAVQQAARLATDRDFKQMMFGVDQKIIDNLLVPWLSRVARQTLEVPATTEYGRTAGRVFSELRKRTGMQAMAGNVLNAAQQITGFASALVRVRPGPLMRGLVASTMAPNQTKDLIAGKSAFMAGRMGNAAAELMGDLDNLLTDKGVVGKLRDAGDRHGYFLQSYFQNFADKSVWMAGYEGAIKAGKSETDAVYDADSAVRTTQGSFAPEDASNFEAQNAFGRLFTMYFSYFNGQYNLARSEYDIAVQNMGIAGATPRLASLYVLLAMIPAVGAEAIVEAARGELGDDDDDGMLDDIAELFLLSQLRYFLAPIPVVGQLGNYFIAKSNNKAYDDRLSTSPVATSVEGAGNALFSVPAAIAGDGKASRAIRDTLNAIGLMTGLPLGQLGKPLGYIADVIEGEQEADGPIDVVQGLFSGRSGPLQ